LFHRIAENFANVDPNNLQIKTLKGHELAVTGLSVAKIASDAQENAGKTIIYSVSKDASIIKWDFLTGEKLFVHAGGLKPTKKLLKRRSEKKLKEHKGHKDHILAVSTSHDGKYLVSKMIYIYEAAQLVKRYIFD
jgi:ribosomal RNA-processing protein 9